MTKGLIDYNGFLFNNGAALYKKRATAFSLTDDICRFIGRIENHLHTLLGSIK